MDAPTRDEIRSLCTEQSFERGVTYYNQDRILELVVDGREVTATVRGSSDYQVSAVIEDDTIRTSCSCPYDYAGDCKHIVAVLLAVENKGADLGNETSGATVPHSAPDVETLVEQTSADELRTFLLEILEDRREIRDRFFAFSGADLGKPSMTTNKRLFACWSTNCAPEQNSTANIRLNEIFLGTDTPIEREPACTATRWNHARPV